MYDEWWVKAITKCKKERNGIHNTEKGCEKFILHMESWKLVTYEGETKSFRTGRLERELQMVQLSVFVSLFCETV
jgi:hypothetical protein